MPTLGLIRLGFPIRCGDGGVRIGDATPGAAGTPTAPTISTFTLTESSTTLSVTWVDNSSDEDGFEVRISYPNGVVQRYFTNPGVTSLTGVISPVVPGVYAAQVLAFNEVGYSTPSSTLTDQYEQAGGGGGGGGSVGAPTAPTIGTLTMNADGSFTLTWTDNSNDETSFWIGIAYPNPIDDPNSTFPGLTVSGEGFTAPADTTSYNGQLANAAGINQAGTYNAYLWAQNANGFSAMSGPATDAVASLGFLRNFDTTAEGGSGTDIVLDAPAGGAGVGTRVIVAVALDSNYAGAVSVSDVRSNSWSSDYDSGTGMNHRVRVFSTNVATGKALVNGDDVTITVPSSLARAAVGIVAEGVAASSYLEGSPVDDSNFGKVIDSGDLITSVSALLVGVLSYTADEAPPDAFTPAAGWTVAVEIPADNGAGTGVRLALMYREEAAGTYAAEASLANDRNWQSAILAYKA